MDYLCCPQCRAPLDIPGGETDVSCSGCGVIFPFMDGFIDFVDARTLEEFARWQREIYQGKVESQYIPYDMSAEVVRRHIEYCVQVAREHGPLVPGWLGMDFRKAADRLEPREGELLLDVGCNTGAMLAVMHEVYGTRGVGVDFSRPAVASAAACDTGGSALFSADALRLPFRDGSFDLAVSFGVIEHVADHSRMVSEMARVLRPGGRMLIYTNNRKVRWTWHWWQRITSLGRYGLGVDDQAGHDTDKFLEPGELAALMRLAALGGIETSVVHTMYTLMFDECFPAFFNRLLVFGGLVGRVRKVLDTADALPSARGYGNEFLATAWKEAR